MASTNVKSKSKESQVKQSADSDSTPAKPAELKVEGITHDRVILKWKDDLGKYNKTMEYTVGYATVSNAENVRYVHVKKPNCTVDSLTPGTKYNFFVIACNDAGESDRSDVQCAQTKGCPAKPVELKVEDITHDRVTLKWKDVLGKDDKTMEYKVGYTPESDAENVRYVHVKKPNCTVDSLTQSTVYNFFVIACNEAGESDRSDVQCAQTKGCPAKPVELKVEDITHDRVTLKWKDVLGKDDKTMEYKVGYTPESDSENVRYVHVKKPNCTVDSLTQSTVYNFFVIACNDAGESDRSDVQCAQTKGCPAKPVELKVEDITHDRVTLKWKDVLGKDDKTMEYKVGYTPESDSENVRYVHVKKPNCTVDSLTQSTVYNFFVIAFNDAGESDRSDVQCAQTKDIQTKWTEPWVFGQFFTVSIIFLGFYLQVFFTGSSSGQGVHPEELKGMALKLDDLDLSLTTLKQQRLNDQYIYKEMIEKSIDEIENKDEKKLKELNRKVDTAANDANTAKNQLDGLERAKDALDSKVEDLKKNLQTQITEIENDFKKKINDLNKFVNEFEETFSTYRSSFDTFEKKTDRKMQTMKATFEELSKNAQEKVKEVAEQIETQFAKLEEAKQVADLILHDLKSDMQAIKPHTFNKESLTTAFCIVIVLEFVLALWIYVVQNSRREDSSNGHKDMNAKDVLERIPRGVTLTKSICIISFDESRQRDHGALVQSALNNQFDTKFFVVRRHEHLLKLPRCKFFIMCTEFSERHVIIEEPGLGLGDLKRCTYNAIQKYRAAMVILYTRDPGSRHLRDQHFNNNIYCVSKQPELVELRDKGQFISIYDALSDFQKNALKDAVTTCLE